MNEEFDALAPIPFEPKDDEGYYVEYVPPIEKPAEEDAPAAPEEPPLPVEERLAQAGAGVITELAVDYVRTFIGSGNNGYSAAYPFESVYTSPKRLLMQGARDEVLVIYRAAGLEKSESWGDGEDHVALELEFMEVLGSRALEALKSGDEEGAAGFLAIDGEMLRDLLSIEEEAAPAPMPQVAVEDLV